MPVTTRSKTSNGRAQARAEIETETETGTGIGTESVARASTRPRSEPASEYEKAPRDAFDRFLQPPTYTVDLSLPPEKRYVHMAEDFAEHVDTLPDLFSEVVSEICHGLAKWLLMRIARLCLWRLYSREETREIKGISKALGIDMYLLVAFNVLLDLFMGCTSGGVRVRYPVESVSPLGGTWPLYSSSTSPSSLPSSSAPLPASSFRKKMLHFRTLDWGMDPLRRLVVRLEFVPRAGESPIATSITYFGFVGVLTGVRKDLSVSLNFRPSHDTSSHLKEARYRLHQLLVLLGLRRSISSLLRQCLLLPEMLSPLLHNTGLGRTKSEDRGSTGIGPHMPSSKKGKTSGRSKTLRSLWDCSSSPTDIARAILPLPSTAAYLTLCDGKETVVIEKDHRKALIRSSNEFIVTLNHDVGDERRGDQGRSNTDNKNDKGTDEERQSGKAQTELETLATTGMQDLIEISIDRKQCVERIWLDGRLRDEEEEAVDQKEGNQEVEVEVGAISDPASISTATATTVASKAAPLAPGQERKHFIDSDLLIDWMTEGDVITNELTHYGCIMDPAQGKFAWVNRYLDPLDFDSIYSEASVASEPER